MAQTAIIVPCRLESSRFPRKLLHNIRGRPLLVWVAERLKAQAPEYPLYFAVDDELLRECVVSRGYHAIMTGRDHPTGTDRLAEANRRIGAECVINVQADEPLVTAAQIGLLAELIRGPAPMATLGTPFRRAADFLDPNQVKVVIAPDIGRALYFSRAPVPYPRDRSGAVDDEWVRTHPCHRHLGLYAYRADLLERFPRLPPGRCERIERLEQLRALENGYEIACGLTEEASIGVDTPEDAAKFAELLG